MKAVHVISGISREGGGPSRSSQALVAALNAAGCETWLLSCHGGDVVWVEGVAHFATPQVGERRGAFAWHLGLADPFGGKGSEGLGDSVCSGTARNVGAVESCAQEVEKATCDGSLSAK